MNPKETLNRAFRVAVGLGALWTSQQLSRPSSPVEASGDSSPATAQPLKGSGYLRVYPVWESERAYEEWEKVNKVIQDKTIFSDQDREDLKLYFPLYFEVGRKYNIPWYLLWITHRDESTVSRNPKAFTGNNGYSNGAQRDPDLWSESYVEEAARGLPPYIFQLKVRHPSDPYELAFMGRRLRESLDQNNGDLRSALRNYCASEFADERLRVYYSYQVIFG